MDEAGWVVTYLEGKSKGLMLSQMALTHLFGHIGEGRVTRALLGCAAIERPARDGRAGLTPHGLRESVWLSPTRAYSKMSSGRTALTVTFGTSTMSLILRSTATLQIAYACSRVYFRSSTR